MQQPASSTSISSIVRPLRQSATSASFYHHIYTKPQKIYLRSCGFCDNEDHWILPNLQQRQEQQQQQQKHYGSYSSVSTSRLDESNEHTPLLSSPLASKTYLRCQKYSINNFSYYVLLLFYILYLIAGGMIFSLAEQPTENITKINLENELQSFHVKYPSIADKDLEEFIAVILKANDRGVSALRNVTDQSNWGFGQSLFFSTTVITTIGYGHVTPLSKVGKIFCIVYAIFGIPFTLIFFTAVVERLLGPVNWLLTYFNVKLGHLYKPLKIRLLHLFIISLIVIILFIVIPTIIFANLEESWDGLDALYYCFITLTTIGLGDYIPGDDLDQPNRALYKVLTTIYLLFGLISVLLVLTIFYDIPQLNVGILFTNASTNEMEKLRLSAASNVAPCYSGGGHSVVGGFYIPQQNEECTRSVVKVRPRGGDDSPSPDEMTPIHQTRNVP